MKLPSRFFEGLLCVILLLAAWIPAGAQPFGLSNRVLNTTLRVPQTLPVPGWTNVNAFPGVVVTNPIAIASPPGETNRLFIVERPGRIAVITNLAAPNYNLFLRIPGTVLQNGENGLLGLAFHPDYAINGLFFVYYSLTTTTPAGSGAHQRVARFAVSAMNANVAATNETVLLTMFDEASNHNGGCLQFGPDGYLYVSLGDEGMQNDALNNTQKLDNDFWSTLLRLDVDRLPGNPNPNPHPAIASGTTNYAIPTNNPFVGVTTWYGTNLTPSKVRTEFYAIGLRNPWRFSFDPDTGRLYCGDVGGGVREEIDIITSGGNYGWAFREGKIAGPKAAPPGAMPIDPIFDYPHGTGATNGNSITGGIVYRGSRYPQLFGRYVFADYESDNVWSILYNGSTVTEFQRLMVDSDIAAFGVDPRNGDVLMADLIANQIKRLVETNFSGQPIPATLADSGAFSNLVTLTPHEGLVPYDVNVPYWSDGALKSRWFYIPTNVFVTFRATQNYTFPTGSVWIQQFDLELTNGAPASRRRVETRFLVRDTSAVYGLSYRWDEEQTNATLVAGAGLDEPFVIDEGGGILRTQVWRYPARAECLSCHTAPTLGGQALGFNTPQLNRDLLFPNGVTDNLLRSLANAGYFTTATTPTNLHALRALAHPSDENASVEQRVRSYLHANCLACHAVGTGGLFDPRIYPSLPAVRLINGLLNNNGGNANARVVVPNSLSNSMLHARLLTNGSGHLPNLGAARPNPEAIALVERWITNDLAGYQTFAEWQIAYFGATNAPNGLAGDDFDDDNALNLLEYLTGTNPTNSLSAWDPIGIERNGADVDILYSRLANRRFEVLSSTNLSNTNAWQFLNVPENRPYISSTNGTTRVTDSPTNPPSKFYRVRVFEP